MLANFKVVQPWGPNKARDATIVSVHQTADDAFAEIDRLADRMIATGAHSDSVELECSPLDYVDWTEG